mmetsp:Transcript_28138/g.66848  ORF Transcript_28138/g.66848 Transcript_28138/m.66848 type:complete len:267 (+) Transcript_28138:708-1508(+)
MGRLGEEDSVLTAPVAALIGGQTAGCVPLLEQLLGAIKGDRHLAINGAIGDVDVAIGGARTFPELLAFWRTVSVDEVDQCHKALRAVHTVGVGSCQFGGGPPVLRAAGTPEHRHTRALRLWERGVDEGLERTALHHACAVHTCMCMRLRMRKLTYLESIRLVRVKAGVERVLALSVLVHLHEVVVRSQHEAVMVVVGFVKGCRRLLPCRVVHQQDVQLQTFDVHGLVCKLFHDLLRQRLGQNIPIVHLAGAKKNRIRKDAEALDGA